MSEAATPDAMQDALVAAFSAGEVKGAPGPVARIDTHLSHVFLSGAHAFKLKRAVRLPFVDFETSKSRRAACEAELAVNKPLAAGLYLAVGAVTREADGSFALDGAGPAVDWVVAMRRFDQACQFDHLARVGVLTRAHVEGAAQIVARVHAAAKPNTLTGHAADYRHVIHELRETESHGAAKLGLEPGSPLVFERLDFELTRVSGLIEQRRKAGKVRRGHGDLHLRNICLFEGEPTPFDALEFDERLATTDVIYDLAFLLMDLRRIGLAGHANAAMNAYWDEAGEDEAALALLPFFTGLRAAVRMAVAVEAGDLAEAETYRALGLQLLEREPPILVAIGGLSGVGKTAVAQVVATHLPGPAGARVLRTDVLRKRQAHLRFDEKADDANYTAERRAEIYRYMSARAAAAIEAGASVIADATFRESPARKAIATAADDAPFRAYWLDAPLSVRLARVARRVGDASDADAAVAAAQEAPEDLSADWRCVNAERSVEEIAAEIRRDLTEAQA